MSDNFKKIFLGTEEKRKIFLLWIYAEKERASRFNSAMSDLKDLFDTFKAEKNGAELPF